mgnify:CR=1 FL=1
MMGKLTGCLGACVLLWSLNQAVAQEAGGEDPFAPFGELPASDAPPQPAEPEPIIQAAPAPKRPAAYSRRPLTSRSENAHVRSPIRPARTPAQELIQQRELFHAQQRLSRMELRKWHGTSRLRPDFPRTNRDDEWTAQPDAWWHAYQTPVWHR